MIGQVYEKRLRGDIFRLSIISLVTVVIWIGVVTYKALSVEEIKPDVKKQILPLTPKMDLDTMNEIKGRLRAPEADWSKIGPALPEILVLPKESASPAAELESPVATESAE